MPNYDDDIDPRDDPHGRDDFDDRGGSRGDRVIERAKNAVRGPAIALIVTAILCLIGGGLNLFQLATFDAAWDREMNKALNDPKLDAKEKQDMEEMFKNIKGPAKIGVTAWGTIGIAVALLGLLGGIQMMGLKGRGLSYTGAILLMIPCFSGVCCLIGLPFGIWAIIALGKPEVKAGYEAVARGRG